ncbi:hypothetical protein AVEN_164437-1 [Araneus ventricosus]|uniref:Uncharacterized protein n=1 Tax=Araneus ventricosus TaxID=182803 RepID=A0A4Y2NCI6_ARAVE|nr:hypothetical protein AVEN_164437-1 [Araneus ventricosus]
MLNDSAFVEGGDATCRILANHTCHMSWKQSPLIPVVAACTSRRAEKRSTPVAPRYNGQITIFGPWWLLDDLLSFLSMDPLSSNCFHKLHTTLGVKLNSLQIWT